jgi:hypothetical protein
MDERFEEAHGPTLGSLTAMETPPRPPWTNAGINASTPWTNAGKNASTPWTNVGRTLGHDE